MEIKNLLIVGVVLLFLALSLVISNPVTTHFENENISFDYPSNWELSVYHNNNESECFWRIDMKNPYNKQMVSILAENESRNYTKTSNLTISGQKTTYGNAVYYDYYEFQKNGIYYLIMTDAFHNENEINILKSVNIPT
jgi:hypothetical protein